MTFQRENVKWPRILACTLVAIAMLGVTQRASAQVLTNADIVRMVQAKLSDAVIISEIQNSTCQFDTSPNALIQLKQAGINDKVLEAMTEAGHSGNSRAGNRSASPLPTAYGFYVAEAHGLQNLELASVTTRMGLVAAATIGGTNGYAVDGMEGNPPLTIRDSTATIIVFQQSIDISTLHLSELTYVSTMQAYQFNILGTEPAFFRNVYGRDYNDTVQVGLWRPTGQISIRIEPVGGQAGMYRLSPNTALNPGRYCLYETGAMHDANLIFAAPSGRSSQAFYFAVENSSPPPGQPSGPSLAVAAPSQPNCGNYNECLTKGDAAYSSSNWPLAMVDFKAASGMDAAKPDAWGKLGLANLASGQEAELPSAWDNALTHGGTVAFDAWHYAGAHYQKGSFRISAQNISFLDLNGETVFSASPSELSSLEAHHPLFGGESWSFGMKVNGHRFWFCFIPVGVDCKMPSTCASPAGYSQEGVVASYVVKAVQRLAAGKSQ